MVEFNQIGTLLEAKIDVSEIESLDDLANLFFKIGKAVGFPLKRLNLTLKRAK